MFIDQALADNQRFRYSLLRSKIVESLYQPTQMYVPTSNRVDLSSHVELPGEQAIVDNQTTSILEGRINREPTCVKCPDYLEPDSTEDWCSHCHPIHGVMVDRPLPKAEGPYRPQTNYNISDTYYVKSGVVDIWTEGQPNLFKFK